MTVRRVTSGEGRLVVARTCAVCGVWGHGEDWARWSSVAGDEGCGHEVATCSQACRDTPEAAVLVTAYERKHSLGSCIPVAR